MVVYYYYDYCMNSSQALEIYCALFSLIKYVVVTSILNTIIVLNQFLITFVYL